MKHLSEDHLIARSKHRMKHKKHRPIDEPAGYKRADAMARSKDELDEAGESATADKIAINPKKLEKDYEICGLITTSYDITNRDPNFEYCWARCVPGDERQVQQKLALQVQTTRGNMPTWEVVKGSDMKEAYERLTPEGYRRIADTILMRCRKDIYLYLQKRHDEVNQRQQQSTSSELEAFAHETKGGVIAHTDPDDPVVQRIVKQGFSDQMAMRRVERRMREGTMPGAEIGR